MPLMHSVLNIVKMKILILMLELIFFLDLQIH